jgi:hypothetical protein
MKAPGYLDKILSLDIAPGIQHAVVEHQKHCAIWRTGKCTCNPVVRLVDEWPEKKD